MANVGTMITPIEGNQESRIYDISEEIMMKSQFVPFVHDMAYRNLKPTTDVRFQWDEKDYQTTYTQINMIGGYSAGTTSVVVDDASIFTIRDLVRNDRTTEIYQISTVTVATNTITWIPDVGGSGSVTINDNDGLQILGPAMEGASSSPNENNANTTTVYNYAQTMRKSFSFAGNRLRTNSTPGMDYEDFVTQDLDETLGYIERTLIFGQRSVDTTNFNKYRYTTNGVIPQISTNTSAIGGTLSETVFDTFLTNNVFAYGSKQKFMICGANYFRCLKKWATTSYTVGLEAGFGKRIGIAVSEYVAPTGQTLIIYEHELFKNGALPGLAVFIDPAGIRLRYTDGSQKRPENMLYKNGMLQFGENLQDPDTDGYKSEYFCEYGLELRNEAWHSVMTGVTGPA